jgi:cellulose synthase/poly-beta-1,6-N-acetylglucosamine synthase-like glycosyltransferase
MWTGLFVASAAFVAYVLAGYPLLLAWLARRGARPIRRGHVRPTVTVLLPVRNGEAWIRQKLESILALEYPRDLLDVLVISNGCTDATEAIVEGYADRGIRLIRLPQPGKAEAINAGMGEARGEILFFTDVRQQLAPLSLARLVECFADPSVGVASGELVIREGETRAEADTGLYWRYEKWIRKNLSALDSLLGATGCIYAMRRQLAQPLPPGTLLDDVHLPMAAFFRGYRLVLDERAKAWDIPASLKTEFRRKVRTQAGVYQLIRACPALLGRRNRMWIHFVSYKFGRLLLPFALLAAAVASFGLPDPWRPVALAAQGCFYMAAALDLLVPEGSRIKRLTSPVRTFVVLMAAALAAASILFRPRMGFWTEART